MGILNGATYIECLKIHMQVILRIHPRLFILNYQIIYWFICALIYLHIPWFNKYVFSPYVKGNIHFV